MENQKLKVLFITARADIGGGPRHLWDLIQYFKSQSSQEVECFVASPLEEPFGPKFKSEALDWIEIPHRRFSILVTIRILFFCWRHKIQIVHSHGRGAGIYSRFLGLFGFKVIHSWHGFHVNDGIFNKINLIVEKLLRSLTDVFIAVSEEEAKRAISYGVAQHQNVRVVFNGIETNLKDPITEERAPAKEIYTLVSLTRFDFQKGNDLLIGLLAKLPKEIQSRISVRIAGSGDQQENIQALIKENGLDDLVKLVGQISNPEKFLVNADAFISCSRGEGLSYATLEAMKVGCPLILSEVTGHTELKNDAGVSFFKIDSSAEFQQSIEALIQGKIPIPTLPARFRLNTMGESILQIYKELARP